jgi:cell division protein FtsQ
MTVSSATRRPRIDPRMHQRFVAVRRQRGRRRMRLAIAAMVLIVALGGALVVLHSSLLSARHLSVHGATHTPSAEILAVSGLARHPPLVDVDAGRISARLEQLPWVAEARVATHWPDSVTIVVRERTPVAIIAAGGAFVLVDSTGRVLAYDRRPPVHTVALSLQGPGLARPGPPGTWLGASAQPALQVASELPPSLVGQVVGVDLGSSGALSLQLRDGTVALLGSQSELGEKFTALASVLAAAPLAAGDQIDLTVPGEPTVSPRPA